jgi:hypothetical protein
MVGAPPLPLASTPSGLEEEEEEGSAASHTEHLVAEASSFRKVHAGQGRPQASCATEAAAAVAPATVGIDFAEVVVVVVAVDDDATVKDDDEEEDGSTTVSTTFPLIMRVAFPLDTTAATWENSKGGTAAAANSTDVVVVLLLLLLALLLLFALLVAVRATMPLLGSRLRRSSHTPPPLPAPAEATAAAVALSEEEEDDLLLSSALFRLTKSGHAVGSSPPQALPEPDPDSGHTQHSMVRPAGSLKWAAEKLELLPLLLVAASKVLLLLLLVVVVSEEATCASGPNDTMESEVPVKLAAQPSSNMGHSAPRNSITSSGVLPSGTTPAPVWMRHHRAAGGCLWCCLCCDWCLEINNSDDCDDGDDRDGDDAYDEAGGGGSGSADTNSNVFCPDCRPTSVHQPSVSASWGLNPVELSSVAYMAGLSLIHSPSELVAQTSTSLAGNLPHSMEPHTSVSKEGPVRTFTPAPVEPLAVFSIVYLPAP